MLNDSQKNSTSPDSVPSLLRRMTRLKTRAEELGVIANHQRAMLNEMTDDLERLKVLALKDSTIPGLIERIDRFRELISMMDTGGFFFAMKTEMDAIFKNRFE